MRPQELGQQAFGFRQHLGIGISRHERLAQMLGQCTCRIHFRNQSEADQHAVKRSAHFSLRGHGTVEIALTQLAGIHQQVAVSVPAGGRCLSAQGRLNQRVMVGVGVGHAGKIGNSTNTLNRASNCLLLLNLRC